MRFEIPTAFAPLAAGAFLLTLAACGDFQRGDPLPPLETPSPTSGTGGLSFGTDVYPILLDYCESCHSATGEASGSGYILTGDEATDYAAVMDLVNPGDPGSSPLLSRARGLGHTGGALLTSTSTEYQLLYDWIVEGANP